MGQAFLSPRAANYLSPRVFMRRHVIAARDGDAGRAICLPRATTNESDVIAGRRRDEQARSRSFSLVALFLPLRALSCAVCVFSWLFIIPPFARVFFPAGHVEFVFAEVLAAFFFAVAERGEVNRSSRWRWDFFGRGAECLGLGSN